jgi:beta-glucosidase
VKAATRSPTSLFGDVEPGGRLPVTVPRATVDLPPFENYAMAGRTYRFATTAPLYPFGYGLGYTSWELGDLRLHPVAMVPGGALEVSVEVQNVGARSGRTVVQYYVSPPAGGGGPSVKLIDFSTVELAPGARVRVTSQLPATTWSVHDEGGQSRNFPRELAGVRRIGRTGGACPGIGRARPVVRHGRCHVVASDGRPRFPRVGGSAWTGYRQAASRQA